MRAATLEPSREPALPPGFADLYVEHYDFVWRCALRMGVCADDVDDVVQECFVVALRRFPRFDPQGAARASTWLFAILRNVQRNHARGARRRAARLERLAEVASIQPGPGVGRGADAALARRLLDEFLGTLDADKRAAWVLAEIEGLTGPELASALELNLHTANSRLRAARHAFGRHFDDSRGRELAQVQVGRAAQIRAPESSRRAGLPAIAAIAAAPAKLGVGLLGSKWLAAALIAAASLGSAAILGTAKSRDRASSLASGPAPGSASGASGPASGASGPASASSPPITTPTPVGAAPGTVAGEPVTLAESPGPLPARSRSVEVGSAPPPSAERRPAPTRPLERLADARTALLRDDPSRALDLVEAQRFPAELESRRIAVEITALCRLDRATLAEARARAWRDEHPEDPAVATLRGVCWSE